MNESNESVESVAPVNDNRKKIDDTINIIKTAGDEIQRMKYKL
jgi:hypothetical protein